MKINFVEELKWRGMIHDIMPGTEEQLKQEMTVGYIGFDPTADSLHIGSLVQIMLLKHLQRAGHKPIALVGGATGMIGDPSGKSEERNLLSKEILDQNIIGIKSQLEKFLDFDCGENAAEIVNNNDWFEKINMFTFLRDVGKFLTVSYMMSKDSVKKRIETELSFTEFTYQLMQAFDFLWLLENKNCKLQMGGSDQWGNITSGTELIRKKLRKQAFALTCPLVTKADGSKFGKTETGNIWLDKTKTSPYKFYQFWLNVSDEEAVKYLKYFTFLTKEEIENLEKQHSETPHLRTLQKILAKDLTITVHSENDYNAALEASEILFGKGTTETLKNLSEADFLSVFEGVPQFEINKSEIENGIPILDLLAEKTTIFPSKGEAKKMIQGGGVSINKGKTEDMNQTISANNLLNKKYILVQKGKKNYYLVRAE